MTQSNLPMIVPKKTQDGILEYHRQCYQLLGQQYNLRSQMVQIDKDYLRESNLTTKQTRAKAANKYGDPNKYQDVTIPIIMPTVEAAVEYQTSVFLQGNPVFGVVSSPQFMDEALQMETVIDENATRGGWVRELQMIFRDDFKYNLAAMEVVWDKETTPTFETNAAFSTKEAQPKQIVWEGNCLRRWDMYNTFFDCRVAPADMHKTGEFAGNTKIMGRVALKQFIANLPEALVYNVADAFKSGLGTGGVGGGVESYYFPTLYADSLIRQTTISTNWLAWAGITGADEGQGLSYKDAYEVTTLYARIIPHDFMLRVPAWNTPQVWKFIIINHQVLIYAERQTNAHGWLPVLMSQALEKGLTYQDKSLAQDVTGMQSVATALMSSVIAARRRAISDRVLYDPSRISEHHINNDNPSAKIPVRPSAYGKPVGESVYQFPFRDDQSQISLSEIDVVDRLANKISGFNPVRQGQFVKGNKTKKEFDTVMGNSNGRDQMTSLLLEAQLMTPAKHIIKCNMLQYQGTSSLYNRGKAKVVEIDPVALRKAVLEFKVSDGLTPNEKLINGDTFSVALQVLGSTPQLAQGYNIVPMFSYLMKSQGANLVEFEKSAEQTVYEQAISVWQQTTTAITEAMIKNLKGVDGMTVEKIAQTVQKALPPQPKPQDYGYNPQATSNSASGYAKSTSQSAQSPAGQPA